MKNIHIIIIILKILFILLLLLSKFIKYFSKNIPIFIITHDVLILITCIYIIYICFPFNNKNKIEFEKEDFLIIVVICIMLLNTIDFKELMNSFKYLGNIDYNIKNENEK
jgi:hypothetical protein